MDLSCTLGLTACLLFQGDRLAAEDTFVVMDNCDLIASLPSDSFEGPTGFGLAAAEEIEKRGVRLDWPKGGVNRRRSFMQTCSAFRSAFNDKAKWENIDKWPEP